jgi:hypothetical protein
MTTSFFLRGKRLNTFTMLHRLNNKVIVLLLVLLFKTGYSACNNVQLDSVKSLDTVHNEINKYTTEANDVKKKLSFYLLIVGLSIIFINGGGIKIDKIGLNIYINGLIDGTIKVAETISEYKDRKIFRNLIKENIKNRSTIISNNIQQLIKRMKVKLK